MADRGALTAREARTFERRCPAPGRPRVSDELAQLAELVGVGLQAPGRLIQPGAQGGVRLSDLSALRTSHWNDHERSVVLSRHQGDHAVDHEQLDAEQPRAEPGLDNGSLSEAPTVAERHST